MVSLLYCCKKVFIFMNIWMIGKNLLKIITWKEFFYIYLNMEDIIDSDYAQTKRVCKDLEITNLGEYGTVH